MQSDVIGQFWPIKNDSPLLHSSHIPDGRPDNQCTSNWLSHLAMIFKTLYITYSWLSQIHNHKLVSDTGNFYTDELWKLLK